MAYIVGILTEDEEAELKKRGWILEDAPAELIDASEESARDRCRMVWISSTMFDIMSGPDWEKK